MKKIFFLSVLMVAAFIGCESENDDQTNQNTELTGLIKLNEGYAHGAGAWVEIWAKKNYYVGYNNILIAVYDSADPSNQITDGHITLEPMMTMNMMTNHHRSSDHMNAASIGHMHSTPVENPEGVSDEGYFPSAIAFIMPTIEMGNWTLQVGVHNQSNGSHGTAAFSIIVDPLDDALIKSFIADQDTFFLTMIKPSKPIVGINDFKLALYKRNGPMTYPAVEGVSISLNPEMPSMGHGSPNNVDPVSTGNGHYEGKVNFTMTGWWKLNLLLKEGNDTLTDKLYFDINF